jgi:hypothetical protein
MPNSPENGLITLPILTFLAIIAGFILVIISLLFLLYRRAKQQPAIPSKNL